MAVNEGDFNAYALIAVNAPTMRMVYSSPLQVNGMDILTVREATRWAARYCRDGFVSFQDMQKLIRSRSTLSM